MQMVEKMVDGYIKLNGYLIAVECQRLVKFFDAKNAEANAKYEADRRAIIEKRKADHDAERASIFAYRDVRAYQDFIRVRDKHSRQKMKTIYSWFGLKKAKVVDYIYYDWITILEELRSINALFWFYADHKELHNWDEETILKWDWFGSNFKPIHNHNSQFMIRNMYLYDLSTLRALVNSTGDLYLSVGDYNQIKQFQKIEREMIAKNEQA